MIPPISALLSWPVITAFLLGGMRLPAALAVTIIGGYLILPERVVIDFPMLPALDKDTIPALSITLLALFMAGTFQAARKLPGLILKNWIARILIFFVVGGAFATAYTNPDSIVSELSVQRGLRLYDGFSIVLTAIMMFLPMLIGRKFLCWPETQRLLLVVLCVAGCLYAFLAIYEIRMSPQLNRSLYGFFAHNWGQHVRGDGFRPLVFLEHGLQLALFMCMCLLAAAGLFRLGGRYRIGLLALVWVGMTLALSKSLGAQMIAVMLLPIVLFLSIRVQLLAAALMGLMVLTYPVLRGAHVVPLDRVMNFAASVNEQRARSFATRIENEELMLARAEERPLFGWGGWGRSRVRNEKGRDISTADGYWVILIGVGGWVRYIGEFGLMSLPAVLLFLKCRRYRVERETAVLALLITATLIDALPNAGISPVTWLIVGSLWGRLELGQNEDGELSSQTQNTRSTGPVLAREFNTPPPRGC